MITSKGNFSVLIPAKSDTTKQLLADYKAWADDQKSSTLFVMFAQVRISDKDGCEIIGMICNTEETAIVRKALDEIKEKRNALH